MGASSWSYFVPYQSNINQALQELRQAEFAEYDVRQYFQIEPEYDVREYFGVESDHELPETIDELLDWCGTEGTHTIMDVSRVSDKPHPFLPSSSPRPYSPDDLMLTSGTLFPLMSEELIKAFGTDKPTKAIIEEKAVYPQWNVTKYSDSWEGIYIIVYEDGIPSEIFFTGFSGD